MIISRKMHNISPSKTLEIGEKINIMKSQNQRIFSLNSGEPEFDTAEHIKNAATEAIKNGFTKYTEVSGITPLKLAIVNSVLEQQKIKYSQEEIIISNGAKHVIFNLLMSTLNEGDEVILVQPYWNSYADMVNIIGGKIVFFETKLEDDFQINTKKLSCLFTNKTKWIILNYPNNPTGKVLSDNTLHGLVDLMHEHKHINLILDEVYNKIILNDRVVFKNILNIDPTLKNRVFIVNAVSKSYAMTGWRIGYGMGPSHIIKSMKILQSHSTSNPSSISQMAALEAIRSYDGYINDRIKIWNDKLSIVKKSFSAINEIKYAIPDGSFYIFPDFSAFIGYKNPNGKLINDDFDLALYLLEYAKIAVIPGSVFGSPNHLRISFTIDINQMVEAMDSFIKALYQLRQN